MKIFIIIVAMILSFSCGIFFGIEYKSLQGFLGDLANEQESQIIIYLGHDPDMKAIRASRSHGDALNGKMVISYKDKKLFEKAKAMIDDMNSLEE